MIKFSYLSLLQLLLLQPRLRDLLVEDPKSKKQGLELLVCEIPVDDLQYKGILHDLSKEVGS